MLIIDSQSVKNTDTAANKGYDGGKKVSGVKRHIAVDTQGIPHAVKVTTADVTDRTGAVDMIDENKSNLNSVKKILADGGYSGDKFATKINEIIATTTEVVKRNELHKFVVLPKRWIVERSLSWLEKFRRLWKNCERFIQTSQQMIVLAFTVILLRRI